MYPHHVDLRAFVHLRARARRFGVGACHARRADPGGGARIPHRQLVVRRRQQGHVDTVGTERDPSSTVGSRGDMCGICGEIRWDGRVGRRRRGDPDDGRHGVPRARLRRRLRARADRARSPAAVDHRPVRPRRSADGRQRPRADAGVQRLHLQLPGSAQGTGRRWLPVLFDGRQRGGDQGVPPVGHRLRRPLQGHVRLRDRRPGHRCRHAGTRPAGHQTAVSGGDHRDGCGSPRPCAPCSTQATSIPNSTATRCTTT